MNNGVDKKETASATPLIIKEYTAFLATMAVFPLLDMIYLREGNNIVFAIKITESQQRQCNSTIVIACRF